MTKVISLAREYAQAVLAAGLVTMLVLTSVAPAVALAAAPSGGWPTFTQIATDPTGDATTCPNRDFTNIYFAQDTNYWYFKLDTVGNPDFASASASCAGYRRSRTTP